MLEEVREAAGEFRICGDERGQVLLADFQDQGVHLGADGGVARLAGEEGHLAEAFAGAEPGEDDARAGAGFPTDHLDAAIQDDEHGISRLAAGDEWLAGAEEGNPAAADKVVGFVGG